MQKIQMHACDDDDDDDDDDAFWNASLSLSSNLTKVPNDIISKTFIILKFYSSNF